MIVPTDRQIRAARALLGWTQVALADRAGVALSVVKRVETGGDIRSAMLRAICQALESGGIIFISNEQEEGVCIDHPTTVDPTPNAGRREARVGTPRPHKK